PGLHAAIYVLFVVQVVLLLALFASTALSMRGTRGAKRTNDDGGYRMTLGGFTGPFVALIGWLIGGGFSVGVGLWTAQALGTTVLSNEAAVGETDRRTATLTRAAASFQAKAAALSAPAP